MRRLAATCDTLPVRALDKRFPKDLGPELPTETFLLRFRHPQLTDPILIFGDAYLRCTEPEVRSRIARAVRAAFAGVPIPGETDAEYVVSAMQLYVKEKDNLLPYHRDTTPDKGYFRMK